MSIYTKRNISHDEAEEIARRLINSHFHQEPHGRFSIPARPEYDDDLLIYAYIKQQAALSPAPCSGDAMREALQKFVDYYPSGINPELDAAYRMARDALASPSSLELARTSDGEKG